MRRRQRIEAKQPRYENRSKPTENRVCKIVGKGDAGESDLRWKRRDHEARDHCYDADSKTGQCIKGHHQGRINSNTYVQQVAGNAAQRTANEQHAGSSESVSQPTGQNTAGRKADGGDTVSLKGRDSR